MSETLNEKKIKILKQEKKIISIGIFFVNIFENWDHREFFKNHYQTSTRTEKLMYRKNVEILPYVYRHPDIQSTYV